MSLPKTATLQNLPPEWPTNLVPDIRQQLASGGAMLVVLDDDPTGTQTVHDIAVLTEWSVDALSAELRSDSAAFFILTNSRSLPLAAAQALNAEIAANLLEAGKVAGREFGLVSRSDSTLRGHYPGEVDALVDSLGQAVDATLIIPFFLEGGRYTIGDVHYVAEGERLVPAGETPFARDAAFGYSASNLREWVEEKTGGRIPADSVASISLDDVRVGGPERVATRLLDLAPGAVCVVNAASMRDMEVFVAGLLQAEGQGKQFVYRTAASFVQVRAGLASRPLLARDEMVESSDAGGLFVVGSYVPKTTSQLNTLLAETDVVGCEVRVERLLDASTQGNEIVNTISSAEDALRRGEDVVIYTSRELFHADDAESSLVIGQRVSDSLVAIVRGIGVRPAYLVAKGGITSSDVATQALGIRRAQVLGQILPGVPVWRAGEESQHPGLSYVVFPGNVGDDDALVEVVGIMRGGA